MLKNILIALCSIFLAGCMSLNTAAKTTTPGSSEKIQDQTVKNVSRLQTRLDTVLAPILHNGHADFSIYVTDCKHQAAYNNKSELLPSASMIKVYILAYAYQQMQQGKLTEAETITLKRSDKVGGAGNIQGLPTGTPLSIRYLLTKMIVDSDNVATNMLIDRLGMEKIQQYIDAHGYKDTRLQRRMMDFEAQRAGRENYTSVLDLNNFFTRLYKHHCVNPQADTTMIEILKGQTDNDKIPEGLPTGSVFAHKTGEIEGYLHDGGIVYNPQGDYIVIIMAKENYGPATVTKDMVQISKLIAGEIYRL